MTQKKSEIVQIYYDLRGAPIAFDAAHFFSTAIGTLRMEGYESFDVSIVAPDYRYETLRDQTYDRALKDWRLHNLILQLPLLIPGVQNVYLVRSLRVPMSNPRYPKEYGISPVAMPYLLGEHARAVRNGIDPHVFDATPYAKSWARARLGSGKTIIMTVRINDFDTARDTPLEKWFALYEHLSARGYKVFVIPDQHDVMFQRKFEKFPWNTIQEAAMSLDLRLALHQECHTTLSWGGGVAMLLWYSTAKFLMYGSLNGKSGVSSAAYYKSNGITVGEQPEYFFPSQKKDWVPVEDITVEYLVASSEAYLKTLET